METGQQQYTADTTSHRTRPPSRTSTLAAYFRRRPGVWVDGRRLMEMAGSYAWRTRVSELRQPPFGMAITNRQRRVRTDDGRTYTVSEYMYSLTATEAVQP